MHIDICKFESLNGRELGAYVVHLIREGIEDPDFAQVANVKVNIWDRDHVAMSIRLLSEIGSPDANRVIAHLLTYPTPEVRVLAINVVGDLGTIDEHIMEQVVKAITDPADPKDADYLMPALNKPANDAARRIAHEYKSKFPGRTRGGLFRRLSRSRPPGANDNH